MKKNTSVKSIIVLVVICLVIAVAMAAVNMVTAPRIAEAEFKAKQEALSKVCPENQGFDAVDTSALTLPECVEEIHKDKDGEGYVVLLSVKGYDASKPMSVAVGMTDSGEITAVEVISAQGETQGIGSKVTLPEFLGKFTGKTESLEGVYKISGATISSSALIDAVRQSFAAVTAAKEVSANE